AVPETPGVAAAGSTAGVAAAGATAGAAGSTAGVAGVTAGAVGVAAGAGAAVGSTGAVPAGAGVAGAGAPVGATGVVPAGAGVPAPGADADAAWLSPPPDSGTTRRAPANCEDQYGLRRSAIWTTSPVRGASRNMWLPTYMPTWSTSPPPIRKKTRSPSLRSLSPTGVPTVYCWSATRGRSTPAWWYAHCISPEQSKPAFGLSPPYR